MNAPHSKIKPFHRKSTLGTPTQNGDKRFVLQVSVNGKSINWSNNFERIEVIREGVPYQSLEILSKRLNLPVKSFLELLKIPQTTYNKKKKAHALMAIGESEIVVEIVELIDFGINVFNDEIEKFQRWLKKPNVSLGGGSPESYLDTRTGIEEVKNCLQRIDSGSFA